MWVLFFIFCLVCIVVIIIIILVIGSLGMFKSIVKSLLSLDIFILGEDFVWEVGCEMFKDIDYKIFDVDVEICFFVLKKVCGMSCMVFVCLFVSVGYDFGLLLVYLF